MIIISCKQAIIHLTRHRVPPASLEVLDSGARLSPHDAINGQIFKTDIFQGLLYFGQNRIPVDTQRDCVNRDAFRRNRSPQQRAVEEQVWAWPQAAQLVAQMLHSALRRPVLYAATRQAPVRHAAAEAQAF